MKITWYGTATIGIDDGKTRLLFDPFVRMNKHIETTPVEGFVGFDAVLVTHGHFDHMLSLDTLRKTFSIPAMIHEDDAYMLTDGKANAFYAFAAQSHTENLRINQH